MSTLGLAFTADDVVDDKPVALTRLLFPRAEILIAEPEAEADTDCDVSDELFFLIVEGGAESVPDSDMADGGRGRGVALNIEESRRCDVFEG